MKFFLLALCLYFGYTEAEDDCVFPFNYKGQSYSSCTKQNSNKPWCSLDAEYQGRYKYCKPSGECAIPFNYDGKTFHGCTKYKSSTPWCSLTKDYTGFYQACKTQKNCVFPFTYKGKTFTSCTSYNSNFEWCSLDAEYTDKWVKCYPKKCVFPFYYNGVRHDKCIGETKPWCSITTEYHGFYTNCEKEGECVYPFDYRGTMIYSCTTINSKKPWCSLDAVYKGNYKYCEITTTTTSTTTTTATTTTTPTTTTTTTPTTTTTTTPTTTTTTTTTTTPTTTTTTTTTTPSPYGGSNSMGNGDRCYSYGGKGYIFHTNTMDWNSAEYYCASFGWTLTKVYNKDHNYWLRERGKENKKPYWWLGAQDKRHESTWKYFDGSSVTYTQWGPGQPDNAGNFENCAHHGLYAANDDWNDLPCYRSDIAVICEAESSKCNMKPCGQYSTALKKTKSGDYCGTFGDKGFVFHGESPLLKYDQAKEYCEGMGMSLAKVYNNLHNTWLSKMNQNVKAGRYWIGANDRGQEGKFVNPDGSQISYDEWMPARPNKDGDCVAVGTWGHRAYWEDLNCNVGSYLICEAKSADCNYKLTSGSVVLNDLPTGDKCGRFGNKGYLFSKKLKTFDEASDYCAGLGMKLTKVHSEEHNKWLTDHIYRVQARWYWIGASDGGHEGQWTYTDGSDVGYSKWRSGQPDNAGRNEHCAGLNWGTREFWNDFPCTSKGTFICESDHPECNYELQANAPLTHEVETGDQCGRFGDKSYLFHKDTLRTFDDAAEYCSDLGMSLTKIHNEEHNAWLTDMSQSIRGGWWYFGASDRGHEAKWTYTDNSPASFTKWNPGQPDNAGRNEHCAILNWGTRSKWNDIPCSFKGPFICEANNAKCSFSIKDKSTITKEVKTGDQCGRFNNRGYLFRNKPTTFHDATMYCCSLGMRLTKVRGVEHNTWLGKVSSSIRRTHWWIGASDAAKEGDWIYQDASKVSFTKWNPGQPDNAGHREHCGCIGYGQVDTWNDFPCTHKIPFICESDNVNCF